jgi:hypothetical protein
MLLVPTNKFITHNHNSRYYLNDPKFIFNESVNALVRGYDPQTAADNLRTFFNQYNYPLKNIAEIVGYHKNIKMAEFQAININTYMDNPPAGVLVRSQAIETWYVNNTPEPTLRNPYPSVPNCPYFVN